MAKRSAKPTPKPTEKQPPDPMARIVYVGGSIVVIALLSFSFTRILKSNPKTVVTSEAAVAAPAMPATSDESAAVPPASANSETPITPLVSTRPGPGAGMPIPVPNAESQPLDLASIPRSKAEEVLEKFEESGVTIIDVRDKDSYLIKHIPGALQIPLEYVEGEAQYLPKGKPIVTYCTCPNEETSGAAAMRLQRAGVANVTALRGGLDEWAGRGYPTESGMPKQ